MKPDSNNNKVYFLNQVSKNLSVLILMLLFIEFNFFILNYANNMPDNKSDKKILLALDNSYIVQNSVNNIVIDSKIKLQENRIKPDIINDEQSGLLKLNITYISQNQNKVYNGCEAACMLMALNYKGYLNGITLNEFATDMPKSDNPYSGFYLSIFNLEPLEEAHWISPEPLVKYAKEKSGHNNIIDATGTDLDNFKEELEKGNPVILYLTGAFEEPHDFKNGAPENLHVLLLVGYNYNTNEYYLLDPWTWLNGSYELNIKSDRLNDIYTKVGKKAIIVR